jgi:hypothetical protein
MTNKNLRSDSLKLFVYWTLVLLPLSWGVFQVIQKSMALFQ